ncbi:MAG: transposase [Thermomonas sp.]|nr:MAG: transposase [Thermomonas sp.]
MPRHHALRRGRRSIPGQTYLLTSVCLNRVPHFATFEAASAVCRVFADRVAWAGSTPLAWVVMPDHWHALVEMGNGAPLHVLVRGINSHAARAANAARGTSGQVFCGAFHDRALRTEADIRRCVRYIIQNPVCAGLARSFREYPFWDAAWLRR